MTERYEKADVIAAFGRLCRMMDKQAFDGSQWPEDKQIGTWRLGSNPTYGGYVVEEIFNEAMGISQPFGPERRNARDFCKTVYFVQNALAVLQQGGHLTPPA
jgi:hypothetical protein